GISLRDRNDQRRKVLCQRVRVLGRFRDQHFFHPRNPRRGLCGSYTVVPGNQDVDIAADFLRGGYGIEHRGLQRRVVVFSYDESTHQITFASFFSFCTSSGTLFTIWPALRFGGSRTLSVFSRGAASTPSASGVSVSNGFFFAFMMFGSVT